MPSYRGDSHEPRGNRPSALAPFLAREQGKSSHRLNLEPEHYRGFAQNIGTPQKGGTSSSRKSSDPPPSARKPSFVDGMAKGLKKQKDKIIKALTPRRGGSPTSSRRPSLVGQKPKSSKKVKRTRSEEDEDFWGSGLDREYQVKGFSSKEDMARRSAKR